MWFQDQARLPKQVSAPDLQELFQDFRLGNPWHASIPAPYVTRSPAIRVAPPAMLQLAMTAGGGWPLPTLVSITLVATTGVQDSTYVRNESPEAALEPWHTICG